MRQLPKLAKPNPIESQVCTFCSDGSILAVEILAELLDERQQLQVAICQTLWLSVVIALRIVRGDVRFALFSATWVASRLFRS